MSLKSFLTYGAAFALACVMAPAANADEGMWTFDNFPVAKVKETYGVTLDKAWMDKVQGAAVRLSGCSASVVSPDGLVLTNAHCVIGCAQDLSSPEHDYVNEGFLTTARTEEKACPGQSAEILLSITDVTRDIGDVTKGLSGADFVKAQNVKAAELEKAGCGDDKTVRCQVIT
ncbi:MAG: S46 family peptidase, partial [Asticcacaulis sp.]